MAKVEALTYARRIGLRSRSLSQLMDSVERGLKYPSLVRLQRSLDLTAREMASLVDISERTLARRKRAGRLKPEESARLVRVSRIFDRTVRLFEGEEGEAVAWLKTPARSLGGKPPLEFAASELGAQEVENLIGRLEYGVYS